MSTLLFIAKYSHALPWSHNWKPIYPNSTSKSEHYTCTKKKLRIPTCYRWVAFSIRLISNMTFILNLEDSKTGKFINGLPTDKQQLMSLVAHNSQSYSQFPEKNHQHVHRNLDEPKFSISNSSIMAEGFFNLSLFFSHTYHQSDNRNPFEIL